MKQCFHQRPRVHTQANTHTHTHTHTHTPHTHTHTHNSPSNLIPAKYKYRYVGIACHNISVCHERECDKLCQHEYLYKLKQSIIAIKKLLLNVIIGITFITHALLYTFLQTLLRWSLPLFFLIYLHFSVMYSAGTNYKQALQVAMAGGY